MLYIQNQTDDLPITRGNACCKKTQQKRQMNASDKWINLSTRMYEWTCLQGMYAYRHLKQWRRQQLTPGSASDIFVIKVISVSVFVLFATNVFCS